LKGCACGHGANLQIAIGDVSRLPRLEQDANGLTLGLSNDTARLPDPAVQALSPDLCEADKAVAIGTENAKGTPTRASERRSSAKRLGQAANALRPCDRLDCVGRAEHLGH
jgi:hypothetical protein